MQAEHLLQASVRAMELPCSSPYKDLSQVSGELPINVLLSTGKLHSKLSDISS